MLREEKFSTNEEAGDHDSRAKKVMESYGGQFKPHASSKEGGLKTGLDAFTSLLR